jgi:imidazolonepropionase-like amidohydrolase
VAATLNSAYALKLEGQVGSIEEGKQADMILLEA